MELYDLLRNNFDIFAWKPMDMTGVPRSIAEHRLNVREGCAPIRQKKKGQAPERNKDVQEEMAEADEEKTAFHTSQGVYCYTKMSFGLKNDEATYQRLVDKAFKKQIRRNLEVYVDNLVIKSHTEQEILRDIEETFQTLRKINMKLNPKKCTFGAEEGMFLGHVVNLKGIKACPEEAEAVIKLQSPRTLKEVQSLNGKLASLNRFLSKSVERSLPFLKTLKNCIKERFSMDARGRKGIPGYEAMHRRTTNGYRTKVQGKTCANPGACLKKDEKIFPSTPDGRHN
ncbi:reverse transcriptase domain-containing protein [Tanacetum coccineum]